MYAAPAAAGYTSAEPERADALNARFLGIVLRRRWLLLGASVIGITGLATAYAATRPPVFEATTEGQVTVSLLHWQLYVAALGCAPL